MDPGQIGIKLEPEGCQTPPVLFDDVIDLPSAEMKVEVKNEHLDQPPDEINLSNTRSNSANASYGIPAEVNNIQLEKAKKHKAEGNEHFLKGEYDKAVKCYDEAIESCPPEASDDLSTFYQNRAAAYEHKEEWSSVVQDCSAALELNPRYVKALKRRAQAAQVLNDIDLAIEDYTAVCIIEEMSNQESLSATNRLLKQVGMAHAKELFEQPRKQAPSTRAVRSYLNGFCCDPVYNSLHSEKEGDCDETDNIPEKHAVPDGYLHARQLLRDEKFSEVAQCCTNELANPLSPYTTHSLLLRGAMHAISLNRDAATKDLNTLGDMEGAPIKFRVAALVKLGALEASYNNIEEAMTICHKAFNLDPKNADVYHQRGQIYLLMNKIEAAVENFDRVVELEPNFAMGYVQKLSADFRYALCRGDCSTAQKQKVRKQFEDGRRKFPKCIELYLLIAQNLIDNEEYSAADELYKELLSVEPECPVGLVHQGMLLVPWKEDIEGAKALIKQALEVDPNCETALENLATICVNEGDLEEGVRLFNRVIPLAKSIKEMAYYCSLRDAAVAQNKVAQRLDISLTEFS